MTTLELDGVERFTLLQIIPQNVGDLEQSLKAKTLRSRIFGEDVKDEVNWQEQMGQVQFDSEKLLEIEEEEFTFSDKEEEVIAYGFLHDEAEGDVQTDDTYVGLLEEFIDTVRELKDDESG